MNHFFALPLPQDVQQAVAETAAEWQRIAGARASWYEADDYHITLKFLGKLDVADQPRLIDVAAPIAESIQPFPVSLTPVGAFPNLGTPKVLWAGVQPSEELAGLAAQIDMALFDIGFQAESRAFRTHITVARCRLVTQQYQVTQDKLIAKDWPTPYERLFPSFTADRFALMQTRSQQERRNGPNHRYNIVHTFPLGAAHSSPAF